MCEIVRRYNELFREVLLGIQKEIEDKKVQFYCLNPADKKTRSFSREELEKRTVSERCLEYYWIEFSHGGKKYKISMFYKDFDYETGNIHVLPGAVQVWRKRDPSCDVCSIEICKHKFLKISGKKIALYDECGWVPIFQIPLFWNINLIWEESSEDREERKNSVVSILWKYIDSAINEVLKKLNINKEERIFSNQFYERLIPCYRQRLKSTLEGKADIKTGHYQKYALFKWVELREVNRYAYEMFWVKNYGYFINFGQISEIKKGGTINACK